MRPRELAPLLLLLLAALVAVGCGRGPRPPSLSDAQRREWTELQRMRRELGARRGELAAHRARLEQDASDEARAALERQVAERQRAVSELSQRYGGRLVEFIESFGPLAASPAPAPPERRGAIRMKSDEDIAIAGEWIERGGDYRRAIEIYETQRRLDPDYEALDAALRRAREMRRVTAARFAKVERGMTQRQVRDVLGPVNLRLMRSFPERGVEAWLYPQEEGGTAAVYFRRPEPDAPLVVYETVFELPSDEAAVGGNGGVGEGGEGGRTTLPVPAGL
jgi:hypothetical protein